MTFYQPEWAEHTRYIQVKFSEIILSCLEMHAARGLFLLLATKAVKIEPSGRRV